MGEEVLIDIFSAFLCGLSLGVGVCIIINEMYVNGVVLLGFAILNGYFALT